MHGIRRITRTSARLVAACFWLTASVVLAQQPAAPRPQPAVPAMPQPLPAAADDHELPEKAMAAAAGHATFDSGNRSPSD